MSSREGLSSFTLHKELEQKLSEKRFNDLKDTLSFVREYMHSRLLFSESAELQAFMRSFEPAPTRGTNREPMSGDIAEFHHSRFTFLIFWRGIRPL